MGWPEARARLLPFVVVSSLTTMACPRKGTEPPTTPTGPSFASVLRISGGPRRACSAVRVSEKLVLTAAHCVLGLKGDEPIGSFIATVEGIEHRLEPAEVAAFAPSLGRMTDFALLTSDLPPSVAIAPLASPEELAAADRVGDGLLDRSTEVWVAGYSSASARQKPRDSIPGRELFVSQGWLKSRAAYRLATFLATSRGFVVDDRFGPPPPEVPALTEEDWKSLAGTGPHEVYEKYVAEGAPILYHSADYAPGGSGGGVFLSNGHLIGIIPLGATAGSRRQSYQGFGQAYRIDRICRDSHLLRSLPACAAER